MTAARIAGRLAGAATAAGLAGVGLAHGGSLRAGSGGDVVVPTWLFLLTGGAVVGASFLLASLATDRSLVRAIHGWRRFLPAPRTGLAWLGRGVGLLGLGLVLYAGFEGPSEPRRNAAILLVWAGWWAGFAMFAYLGYDAWPAIDPARTAVRALGDLADFVYDAWPAVDVARAVAGVLGDGAVDYPERLGAWPSVAALLALVWIEVVSPLATRPTLLAAAVVGYVAASVAGAAAVGPKSWFEHVDPVSRVFRTYGLVAPLHRTDGGVSLGPPGWALVDAATDADFDRGEVAFVIALLWGTTFDGLVATRGWRWLATPVVDAGGPPRLVYLAALVGGFAAFFAAYRVAVGYARRTAPTYLSTDVLARTFVPSLIPIAAGYHFAHYIGYFLGLLPALIAALASPAGPGPPSVLVLPGWFGGVGLLAVLVGHVGAVWTAHAVAFETFPGRLQAVRSQVPLTGVMVLYTMISLWIVSRPTATVPFL